MPSLRSKTFRTSRTFAAVIFLAPLCAMSATPARAQNASGGSAAAPTPKVIALRAAKLITAKPLASASDADAPPIANAVVIIEGDRIKAVGSNLPIPAGAEVIDLGDKTLLPGLIDAHTHLLLSMDAGRSYKVDDVEILRTVATMSTAERALMGAKMGLEDLQAGITTVRDLGNSGVNGDVALRDAIDRGWVAGPRIVASTRALAAPGGQLPTLQTSAQNLIDMEYVTIDGAQSARQAVRQALYDGAKCIKVIVNGPANVTAEEMKAIVEQAHTSHVKVAAHATDDEAVRIAVNAGADSVEHGYELSDEILKTMAQKHIFLVPTDWPADEYVAATFNGRDSTPEERAESLKGSKMFVEANNARLKRAVAAGVPIAAGSDMCEVVPGQTRGQASLTMITAYAGAGLTPMQVIHAATSNAAELLDEQKNIGSIEVGKFADLIAVPGDPLKDVTEIEHAKFVMKGGVVIKNEN